MKIVIVSDNHRQKNVCHNIYQRYQNEVDLFLHCGDSEFDYDNEELQHFVKVRGNCDCDERYPLSECIDIEAITIMLTHGHYFYVGSSRQRLAQAAKDQNASIAIYGHTHLAKYEVVDGVLCINPGSIAQSRDLNMPNSYAILEKMQQNITLTYYDQQHNILLSEHIILNI